MIKKKKIIVCIRAKNTSVTCSSSTSDNGDGRGRCGSSAGLRHTFFRDLVHPHGPPNNTISGQLPLSQSTKDILV